MRYAKPPGVTKPVARVLQGTTIIGSDLNEGESFALLDQVYELGCKTIDTAHVYSTGNSERTRRRRRLVRAYLKQFSITT